MRSGTEPAGGRGQNCRKILGHLKEGPFGRPARGVLFVPVMRQDLPL
jgi:hypothetical protein